MKLARIALAAALGLALNVRAEEPDGPKPKPRQIKVGEGKAEVQELLKGEHDHDAPAKTEAKPEPKKLEAKVTPEASDTSKSLQDAADKEQAKLRGMKGVEFDREYLENEVAYHKQVLGAISDTLIPNAQNAELKQMLVDVKPAFQAHLDHAQQTLAALDAKH